MYKGFIYGIFILVLLSVSALAQAQDSTAICIWTYSDTEIVNLGETTLDDCAGTLYSALEQYNLSETYGTWGQSMLYVAANGEVYTADFDIRGMAWELYGTFQEPTPAPPVSSGPLTLDEIFALAQTDINDYWAAIFADEGLQYTAPRIVLFDGAGVDSRCGAMTPRIGPAYCPADHTAYFPRGFMEREMTKVGDYAVVVIIAHEWAHAVQALAGLNEGFTIEQELQADCFAGAYSDYATNESEKVIIEEGDLEEGATALFLFGDPEGLPWFDPSAHGSGEQRYNAYVDGLRNGYTACL